MKPRILIIEDYKQFRASLRDALSRVGLEIDEADGLEAAERALRARSYDAILSDLTMPEVEGTEILDRIADLQPEAPVVVISGSVLKAKAPPQCRVHAWLEKPCSIRELRAVVRDAIAVSDSRVAACP